VEEYAGLVSRLTGLIMDVVLLTVLCLTVRILPVVAWEQVLPGDSPGWLEVLCGVAAALLPWAYFTTAWSFTGQTVGGLLIGTVVRRNDGRELGFLQAAARALVGLLLAPVWFVGLIGVLADQRRRAWHDRVFRTVVRFVQRHHK